ncbi:hypothetical protein KSF78_0009375 [Schistosoma japonicum]|nr:hypothetical protein KSF78_0009375 [Schistosoma japonicum]
MIVSELHKHVNRCKTLVSQLFNIKPLPFGLFLLKEEHLLLKVAQQCLHAK